MLNLIYDTHAKRLGPLLRGHLLWYELREAPTYSAWSGLRLLLIVLVLELLIGPRMTGLSFIGLAPLPAGPRTLILLAVALASTRLLAGVKLTDIGLVAPWRWRAAESLYLVQAFLGAGVVFVIMFGARLGLFSGDAAHKLTIGGLVLTQLLWGFYQEVIYRGMLQTELARRFGALPGALIANLAFTFGPLHLYHLVNSPNPAAAALMMAAIFAIGLVFAFIFARSRNVWLVGLLHGIGNVFGNVS